jgi:PKD repeat protein
MSSNASSFSWDFGDGNTSTDLQPVNVYANPGLYTVTLTTSNGCGSSSVTKVINIGVSSIANKEASQIIAYPNPNSGILNLESDIFKDGNSMISIIDIRGVEVYKREINSGNKEVQLNIEHLKAGIFILKITNSNSNVIMKIEKE